MQFLITAYDAADEGAYDRRMAVRADHLEGIKKVKETGSVVCAGGLRDDNGKLIGSALVMEFASRDLLDQYLQNEPYVVNNVWGDVRVDNITVVVMNDEMLG